jgi:hypothetical protein
MFSLAVVGQDTIVGIVTRSELQGSGIESQWGSDFAHLSRQLLEPIQHPVQCVTGLFPGHKVGKALH